MSPDPMHVLQLALGFVFLVSAGGKAVHAQEFVDGLREYDLIPRALLRSAAAGLIGIEALLAVAHLTGIFLAPLLVVELMLLAGFLGVTVFALRRRSSARCLCFGRPGEAVSPRSAARLAIMIAGTAALSVHAASAEWQPVIIHWDLPEGMNAILGAVLALIVTSWLLSSQDVFQIAMKCKRCQSQSR